MSRKAVMLGGMTLGAGHCAVCVPVMGGSLAQLAQAAADGADAGADLLELRADSLCALPDAGLARAMCEAVREAAPDLPLLFTLRTARDGGEGDGDCAAYEALLCEIARQCADVCDAVDVELSVGEAVFSRIAYAVKAAGMVVVGSNHDFEKTPQEDEIVSRLVTMARLGAHVSKIAVMPETKPDVLTLMRAAARADEALDSPVIAIAMGPLGVMTRICGEAFGSCLTFASAGRASAPGQVDARKLRGALELIHDLI